MSLWGLDVPLRRTEESAVQYSARAVSTVLCVCGQRMDRVYFGRVCELSRVC